jgi:parallel beta-helix repeat protein/predicted outer membrane repeat protein
VGNVSLREAIEAIADGGTITFDETLEGLISLSLVRGPLTIDKNLSIFGPGSETISISGGTDIRVIQVFQLDESRQPQVLIKGLSIVQGEAGVGAPAFFQQDGGGILNVGADLTLDEVRLSGNSALNGGAIYNTGSVTLVNCTGSGNIAEFQGGFLATTGQGEVFIQNTTIADNAARLGGGISAAGKTTLINSTLSGNRAFDSGGGLHHTAAAKTTLVNCTVFSNVADTTGAANGNGGGIFVVSGAAPVDLRNTIVGGNFDNTGTGGVKHPDLSGQFFGAQSNLVGDPTGSVGIGGTDVVLSLVGDSMNEVIEPVLADNGGPTLTHDLRLFSPAVNAGTNLFIADALYGADQRGPGFDRIRRGIVDIGAIELQPNSDGLTVVIELDPAQDTLTAYMPLRFFITFSEAVQDFTADDLDNAGTAPNVVFTVTPIGGGVYEILANTDSNGTIIPRLRPGSVTDSWSTATDLTDPSAIIVGFDTTLDTDSDGVLDIDEAQTDADGDGDADFLDADADNDGVPDGIEADLGTDPTDTTTPDSTLTLSQSDFEVGENGGTVTITLVKYGAAVLNWQAIVESGGEWLTITTGESGTDGGVIVLTYDRNLTQVNRAAAVELTAPGASAFPRTIVVRQAACALPDAPANAIAQLVEDDSILRIQWDVAAGATEYELRLSANPLLPPIAIVDENSFDIAYNPPTGLFANCNGDFIDPTQQTYFVRSVNDCGPSAFSQALSNIDTKAQPDALPAIAPDAEVRAVSSNEPVALRLEAAAPINADTLWYEAPVEATAEFIPLEEDGHTGWALIAPVGEWPADATFTVSAGGVNAQGIAVSLSADFAVGKAKAAGATVISGGLFAEPQTVSLPVPAGLDAATAEVEFYIGDGAAPGWYPVAQVEGLLPTPEYFVDGNSIAVSINYGGAFRVVDGTLGTTPASGIPTGDALLAALILIALAAGARVCRKSVVAVPAGS